LIRRTLPIGVSHAVFKQLLSRTATTRRGRPMRLPLAYRLRITLFKLRYNLPYRTLEAITGIDHVTLSRSVNGMLRRLSELALHAPPDPLPERAFVDTTTIRIGKASVRQDYTGYKHLRGVKFQCIATSNAAVLAASPGYSASIHDKKVFEREYPTLPSEVRRLSIIGDKAYVGLEALGVTAPEKRCTNKYKADPSAAEAANRTLSKARVVIEHVFASLKRFRILSFANYFSRDQVNRPPARVQNAALLVRTAQQFKNPVAHQGSARMRQVLVNFVYDDVPFFDHSETPLATVKATKNAAWP
jgi:hypothetical protein